MILIYLNFCRVCARRRFRTWWSVSGTSSRTSTSTKFCFSCATTWSARCSWPPPSSGFPPAAWYFFYLLFLPREWLFVSAGELRGPAAEAGGCCALGVALARRPPPPPRPSAPRRPGQDRQEQTPLISTINLMSSSCINNKTFDQNEIVTDFYFHFGKSFFNFNSLFVFNY